MKRLIKMNQYGDVLFCGKDMKGNYRGMGDYPENLNKEQVKEIMKKLYYFEEHLEDIIENMDRLEYEYEQ